MQNNTILNKYIHDKQINIPEDEWARINIVYPQYILAEALKREILIGNIELPLRRLSIKDASMSFKNLIGYKCNEIKSAKITTRYDYEFDNAENGRYIDERNIGNIASDYFQQYNRFACDSMNSPSPVRVWQNEKFLNGMINAIYSLKQKSVNDRTFRTCLALRKYTASQFKPTVAKSVYEKFNAVDVLDFSAGWGDRFCGFYACQNTKSYIGIDPNVRVHEGYNKQEEFYSRYIDGKTATFICKPAEEVSLPNEIVDLVFTSPPYFNIEKYCQDDTQSFKRYKKLDDWLEKFLFKAIYNSYIALKKDGYMIINISDAYSNHRINHICDPMNYYIQSLGMKYEGVIGIKMAKRPNSKAIKDGIFVEPMWIWRK